MQTDPTTSAPSLAADCAERVPAMTAEQAFASIHRAARALAEAALTIQAAMPHATREEQAMLAWCGHHIARLAPELARAEHPADYSARIDRQPYRGRRIYFAQAVDGGPVKIGFTADVPSRLKQLAYKSKTSIRLLGWMPGDQSREREIHEQFAAYRVNGNRRTEWFDPVPELLAFIEREAEHGRPGRRTTRRSRSKRTILG